MSVSYGSKKSMKFNSRIITNYIKLLTFTKHIKQESLRKNQGKQCIQG